MWKLSPRAPMQKLRLNIPLFKKFIRNYDCFSNNFTIINLLLVQDHLEENLKFFEVSKKH